MPGDLGAIIALTGLVASIGIMAGSYAHNIKNLLVRPNDLLARCMAWRWRSCSSRCFPARSRTASRETASGSGSSRLRVRWPARASTVG